jgi:hypothetical protein
LQSRTSGLIVIQQYVALQKQLLHALRIQFDLPQGIAGALDQLPRRGEVNLTGMIWDFTRHGSGVLFRNRASGCRVDIPERVDDPAVIDEWRLGTYFRSMGKAGMKQLHRAIGQRGLPAEDSVALLLERLHAAGHIRRDEGCFRLDD